MQYDVQHAITLGGCRVLRHNRCSACKVPSFLQHLAPHERRFHGGASLGPPHALFELFDALPILVLMNQLVIDAAARPLGAQLKKKTPVTAVTAATPNDTNPLHTSAARFGTAVFRQRRVPGARVSAVTPCSPDRAHRLYLSI